MSFHPSSLPIDVGQSPIRSAEMTKQQRVGRRTNPSFFERLAFLADLNAAKSPARGRTFSREQKNGVARKTERRGGEITLRNVHRWIVCSDVSAYLGEEQTVGKQESEGSRRRFQKEPQGLFGALG